MKQISLITVYLAIAVLPTIAQSKPNIILIYSDAGCCTDLCEDANAELRFYG